MLQRPFIKVRLAIAVVGTVLVIVAAVTGQFTYFWLALALIFVNLMFSLGEYSSSIRRMGSVFRRHS